MALLSGWANRITIARGFVAVALAVVLHRLATSGAVAAASPPDDLWMVAFVLFVVGAVTDVLDGWIARRYGEVSVFGRIADPFVDKLLILGTGIFLVAIPGIPEVLPAWVVALILAREMLVTALRSAIEAEGGNFQAGVWGKAKMVLQCVAIAGVIVYGAGHAWIRTRLVGDVTIVRALVLATAALTALSGLEYVVRGARLLGRGAGRG